MNETKSVTPNLGVKANIQFSARDEFHYNLVVIMALTGEQYLLENVIYVGERVFNHFKT